jgi:hypothetical protein
MPSKKEAAELELHEHTDRLLVPVIIAVMKGRDVEHANTQAFKVSCILTSMYCAAGNVGFAQKTTGHQFSSARGYSK